MLTISFILSATTYAAKSTSVSASKISQSADFVTLGISEMHIDSVLPHQQVKFMLPSNYADSVYTIRLLYPEYTKMKRQDARRYRRQFGSDSLPAVPSIDYAYLRERTNNMVVGHFNPVVKRGRQLYYLSSYKAQLLSEERPQLVSVASDGLSISSQTSISSPTTKTSASTYATHSMLASGTWAKIRVSDNGIYALTSDVIRKAGFSDLAHVKVYGYGGTLIPESLTQTYLSTHDDLQEVPTLTVGNKKLFYAHGSVSYDDAASTERTRNPYSDYGYYFITQTDGDPATCSEAELLSQYQSAPEQYHTIYEKDEYAWTESGRNLYDGQQIKTGNSQTYNISVPAGNTTVRVTVKLATDSYLSAGIYSGSESVGSLTCTKGSSSYTKAAEVQKVFTISNLEGYTNSTDGSITLPLTVTMNSGNGRLDYILATYATPQAIDLAAGNFPSAEYVGKINNQDHHADDPVDLVIIIPTSQSVLEQAQRLATLHQQYDGMTTRIIPANELYNEYSSGVPDVSAYRRYLKMFYDRAEKDSDIPGHVLLFGASKWDNRLRTISSAYNADDLLLVWETENSLDSEYSYASDDIVAILADNKSMTRNYDKTLQFDVAVGRIPTSNLSEAKGVVDKISSYMQNSADGTWQNTVVFIGDDGDDNLHMTDVNSNADAIVNAQLGYDVKKIMLDAYKRQTTSVGNRYPDVTSLIKTYQQSGALMINYAGHGAPTLLSHESILTLSDVGNFSGTKYPVWVTAACEVGPFETTSSNIGTQLLLNSNGGAIAYYGATRTVLASRNAVLNEAFTNSLLTNDASGNPRTIGQAQREAKNLITSNGTETSSNKHQYVLLGDPALHIAAPKLRAVFDRINDTLTTEIINLQGNQIVKVTGHIEDAGGNLVSAYNGRATLTAYDGAEQITCRANNGEERPFVYTDRTNRLFQGSDSIRNGQFTITFRLPREIQDEGNTGKMMLYATNGTTSAHGETVQYKVQGVADVSNDSIGPNIYCYLNTPSFTNGSTVGRTPYFVAEISDKDGIDATGMTLGQNLQLVVDNKSDKSYDLSDSFTFDNGSYTSGKAAYVIPELDEGKHSLVFRAWDLLGNMSSVQLTFNVARDVTPAVSDVFVSPNPISGGLATFYILSDMTGSSADVCIDIISPSGRLMQTNQWRTTLTSGATAITWEPSGLVQGLYLYRVRVSCDGYNYSSNTKKLILAQ